MEQINLARTNPSEFAQKVLSVLSHIKDEEGKLVFELESGLKVGLVKGEQAFLEIAEMLRNQTAMSPIEFKEDLIIPVPEAHTEWKKQESITAGLTKLKNDTNGKYQSLTFNLDLGVSDPLLSAILQVVDDSNFKGKRRVNILDKDVKFAGISHAAKGKKSFCSYIAFAK